MRLDDEGFVRGQYASTDRLSTRISVWQADPERGTPQDVVLDQLRRRPPRRLLEVGCGTGALARRIVDEVGCEVVAVDQSPAMVEAACGAGVAARLGDVQQLDLDEGGFDCALAAWMLYHVPDVDRALSELRRVLEPGGRLVAVTNGRESLGEVYDAVGATRLESSFLSENGEQQLLEHFDAVRRIDVRPRAVFGDREQLAAYLASLDRGELADRLGDVAWPFVAHGAVTVFVAERGE
jgi:SAM-dependent methyltransferase